MQWWYTLVPRDLQKLAFLRQRDQRHNPTIKARYLSHDSADFGVCVDGNQRKKKLERKKALKKKCVVLMRSKNLTTAILLVAHRQHEEMSLTTSFSVSSCKRMANTTTTQLLVAPKRKKLFLRCLPYLMFLRVGIIRLQKVDLVLRRTNP